MEPFPHKYETTLRWEGGREATLEAPSRPPMPGGPPRQFDGSEDRWSPEHLLLQSIDLCLMTTFFSLAEKKGFEVLGYDSGVAGTLDKTKEGLVFTEISQLVRLQVKPGQEETGKALMQTAKKYCLIANALKPEIKLEVRAAAQPVA